MPIDSNRYKLLSQQLTIDPKLVAAFEKWIVVTSSGQIIPISESGSCTLDKLMSAACADLARDLGRGAAPQVDPSRHTAMTSRFSKIPPGVWKFLAGLAAGQGKSTWKTIYGSGLNQFSLKPLELGQINAQGAPEYKSTLDFIGSGVDLGSLPLIGPRLITRRYASATHFDISPMIFYGLDAVPAWSAPVRGGGMAIKVDGVQVQLGIGKPQSGGLAIGFHLDIPLH